MTEQKALIRPVLRLLKKYQFVVIGDREFHGVELSHCLKKLKSLQKISFVFRQKMNTHYKKTVRKSPKLPLYLEAKMGYFAYLFNLMHN